MPKSSTAPNSAIAINGTRQPSVVTSSEPTIGASIGAAVKIITITVSRRAASTPLAMSRTIARVTTTPTDAAMPCTNRAVSISSMLVESALANPATVKMATPTYMTGMRPSRSESTPAGNWPIARPAMNSPTICWPADIVVARSNTIAGIAGRLMSIDTAASPVRQPSTSTKRRLEASPSFIVRSFPSGGCAGILPADHQAFEFVQAQPVRQFPWMADVPDRDVRALAGRERSAIVESERARRLAGDPCKALLRSHPEQGHGKDHRCSDRAHGRCAGVTVGRDCDRHVQFAQTIQRRLPLLPQRSESTGQQHRDSAGPGHLAQAFVGGVLEVIGGQ